ncbi:hypothetical protein EVAR_30322_1 [Eumeta japonica]|uniref:Uncharacterized protein n=1 Tax=Eumeta variegata TaxID=151549 RepID=A0A4C1W8B8_EUMVA|nr:hypothetical protein EVAR_30322_1 [Eumeta japonica]
MVFRFSSSRWRSLARRGLAARPGEARWTLGSIGSGWLDRAWQGQAARSGATTVRVCSSNGSLSRSPSPSSVEEPDDVFLRQYPLGKKK